MSNLTPMSQDPWDARQIGAASQSSLEAERETDQRTADGKIALDRDGSVLLLELERQRPARESTFAVASR
jgi:hypothetical protein